MDATYVVPFPVVVRSLVVKVDWNYRQVWLRLSGMKFKYKFHHIYSHLLTTSVIDVDSLCQWVCEYNWLSARTSQEPMQLYMNLLGLFYLWKYVSSWCLSITSWMKVYVRVGTLNKVNKAKYYCIVQVWNGLNWRHASAGQFMIQNLGGLLVSFILQVRPEFVRVSFFRSPPQLQLSQLPLPWPTPIWTM